MITNNAFVEQRKPEDVDLVIEITKLLAEANHPNPQGWTADAVIQEAIPAAPKLQRFLINRYWRTTLGMCTENTTRERYCLIDVSDRDENHVQYLKIFKDAIIPSIVKNGL